MPSFKVSTAVLLGALFGVSNAINVEHWTTIYVSGDVCGTSTAVNYSVGGHAASGVAGVPAAAGSAKAAISSPAVDSGVPAVRSTGAFSGASASSSAASASNAGLPASRASSSSGAAGASGAAASASSASGASGAAGLPASRSGASTDAGLPASSSGASTDAGLPASRSSSTSSGVSATASSSSSGSSSGSGSSSSSGVTSTSSSDTAAVTSSSSTPTTTATTSSDTTATTSSSTTTTFVPTETGPAADSAFAQEVVSYHNYVRNIHGSQALAWDQTLADFAQSYADYLASDSSCPFAHSRGAYGENLAIGYASIYDSMKAWYDENQYYDYAAGDFVSSASHFTQMVWNDSTAIGCGIAQCSPDGGSPYASGYYLVCEYNPRGNYLGEFTTNVYSPSATTTAFGGPTDVAW